MIVDDQAETIAFLQDPASYGGEAEAVERIETHISVVFLAGGFAYKLKRAVRYSYLDFSTVEKRAAACAAELALNRRTAPALYLETRAIRRRAGGRLGFEGEGALVDTVVVMRRFDQSCLFDRLAQKRCPHPGADARARRSNRRLSPKRRGRPEFRRSKRSRRDHRRQ